MVDLTQQNQETTKEVNRQRWQQRSEEHERNSKNEGTENDIEGGEHSRGTITQRVPHLEREIDQMKKVMDKMKDSMRRANHVDEN